MLYMLSTTFYLFSDSFVGKRSENCHSAGPTHHSGNNNSHHCTTGIYEYISLLRASPCAKGLMIFIKPRKRNAEASGTDHQPDSPEAVYIQRKGNRNTQKEIFCEVRCFPYIILRFHGELFNLFHGPASVKGIICHSKNLDADLIAESTAGRCILIRKSKNKAHHYDCG